MQNVLVLEAELAPYAVMHVTREQRFDHLFYCMKILRTSISIQNFYIGGDKTVPMLNPRERALDIIRIVAYARSFQTCTVSMA